MIMNIHQKRITPLRFSQRLQDPTIEEIVHIYDIRLKLINHSSHPMRNVNACITVFQARHLDQLQIRTDGAVFFPIYKV